MRPLPALPTCAVTRAGEDDSDRLATVRIATVALDEVAENAGRIIAAFGAEIAARTEVVWLDRPVSEESSRPDTLRVAPLQVGGLLAERLFKPRTVVLTSATLTLGGSFEPLARQWGLPQLGCRTGCAASVSRDLPGSGDAVAAAAQGGRWRGSGRGRRRERRNGVRASAAGTAAWTGPASMSARRSTTAAARSCTSPGTCRHQAGTGCRRPT